VVERKVAPSEHGVRPAGSDPGVSGILLAAGSSRRFGKGNKLLALLDGRPLIRYAAEVLAAAGLAEVIVVTGPDAEAVRAALAGLEVRLVHNARYLDGMGGSVAAGIRAVSASSAGALLLPGDMPRLDPALVRQLIDVFMAAGGTRIVYPCLPDGSQRNPVLWPRRFFAGLAALSGESGAKPILNAHAADAIAVTADVSSFRDIDTVDDLACAQDRSSTQTADKD
jgi:molybdenum cofactor cytidylyltransferase